MCTLAHFTLDVHQKAEEKDGQVYSLVLATDMALITDALKRNEAGAWQGLFPEIMGNAAGDGCRATATFDGKAARLPGTVSL
jgi:hypothetical protein